jgi:G patch domain-containing protein 1
MAGDANQGRDTLTYTKPTIDIFKAIFASDDEDDSDDEDEVVDVKPVIPVVPKAKVASPTKMKEKPLAAEDLAAFKPVYRKAPEQSAAEADKKKKKDKKKRKGVLSFDVGDEGEEDASAVDRRKKRKERETHATVVAEQPSNGHEEEQWVEKTGIPISRAAHRKGAADFM